MEKILILKFFIFWLIGISYGVDIKVVDGDSLFIDNKEIRLSGIDAPEYHQQCYDSQEKLYPCGKKAAQALQNMIKNKQIICKKIITDRYKREVSVCTSGKTNLNYQMVNDGWAVAYTRYTKDYVSAEQKAKKYKRGIWNGRFLKPEYYRILTRETKNKH